MARFHSPFSVRLNQSSSTQRSNIVPLTAFTGRSPTHPITTFMFSQTFRSMKVNGITLARGMAIEKLEKAMAMLHPVMEHTLMANRARARANAARRVPANFSEGDVVLVARDTFQKSKKLCLHWRGPRCATKDL